MRNKLVCKLYCNERITIICFYYLQAGDRYDFTGTLIVVPDVGSLSLPGAKAELTTRTKMATEGQMEGIKGLKALGVRELHYKYDILVIC